MAVKIVMLLQNTLTGINETGTGSEIAVQSTHSQWDYFQQYVQYIRKESLRSKWFWESLSDILHVNQWSTLSHHTK